MARALKTEDELKAIPLGQEVLVEIPGIDPAPEVEKTKPETEGAETLKAQLEAIKREREEERQRLTRERDEARKQAEESTKAVRKSQDTVLSAEESSANTRLSSAQTELAAAEAELERAGEAGDFKAMGKAQAKIGRAAAQIASLEGHIADIADRKEVQKAEPEPVTQQPQVYTADQLMTNMRSNPNLLTQEKEWFSQHPEALTDKRLNDKLGFAYEDAIAKGFSRGSAEYFEFINERMGYKPQQRQEERDVNVSAPAVGNGRGANGNAPGTVRLTPDERETARNLGISEIDYAKQKIAVDAARKADPEKYGNRS